MDKAIALGLLVVLAPLFLVVFVAMGIDMLLRPRDRGGFFYREQRVSRGRTFGLLKFRTLRADVLERSRGHAALAEHDAPNLTWAGRRILKPWYLDELPQLLNILRGDISLVGPRPWPPQLVERQIEEGQDYRLRIVAGLTGPAQVTKGSDRPYVDFDLTYVARCQALGGWALVRYDLGILRQTLSVIARGEGLNY